MHPRRFRRSARQLAVLRRRRRAVAVTVVMALALVFIGQPVIAMGATLPSVSMPSLSGLVGWLTSGSPQWGRLPQQLSGTAAGHEHRASAASTRADRGTGHTPKPGKGELPVYAPYARRVAKGPSAAILGFNARSSKRVASKSTATSDYYQNADGSYTRQLAEGTINYQDSAGNWQPIQTQVRLEQDGRWHESANSLQVDVAPAANAGDLAHVGLDAHHGLSYGLRGAAPVRPVVSGSTVTYPAVLPGTDLVLQSGAIGLKESLVLRSDRAPNSWSFPLNLSGLSPVKAADGAIDLVGASGRTVVEIPPAYAYDARVASVSGEHATTHAVTYRLETTGGRTDLVMTLDQAWLHARGRVFPVVVDPSVDNAQALTTYAESGNPGDHSMEQTIKVGSYNSGTNDAVSYLAFPNLGLDGSKATVSAASLHLFDVWSSTCTAERFDVAPVTKAWTPSGVTSYPGPSYGASIGNLTPSTPIGCANSGGDMSKGDNLTVPLTAATFNTWAAATGATNDYGLAVYASTADALHWKQFGSIYNLYGAPSLQLTYTGALLPQVVASTPANNSPVTTLTPQLTATGQDDPNLTTTLKYDFQVYNTSGTKVADSGLITADYYNVPAGDLTWGQSYDWEVQAYDGTNYSAGPNWQQLTTQVPQPVVTSGLSQNTDGHGYDPAIGNYTTTATDANVATPGPSLSVVRDYNSRDPRTTGAFGAGWSSVFDARATEQYNASGAVSSVNVTYPDGSVIGYGKNSNGSGFSAPQGRFASFASVTGGYSLTDKNDTVYAFTQPLGSGVYGITSITDADGRAETFLWTSGEITTMTSAVSQRALHLTWSTPAGAGSAHVATVSTDPVTAGVPATALNWNYSYTGDQLTKMCSPTDTTSCTQYGYASGSQYYNEVLDQGPSSFWPLAESSGTTAASAVLAREGADDGTYSNVTLGQAGPLTGGSATAAGFNGTSSSVQLPNLGLGTSSSQSMSLWFKTSTKGGVLFSYSDMPVNATATLGDFTPSLYVGTDGKLNGLFWYGTTTTPIVSAASVADGKWHHVVLAGSWTAQTMYLDGGKVGTAAGYGSFGYAGTMPWLFDHVYLGTGYLGSTWPDQPHLNSSTIYASYFNGSIADAAFYGRPLAQADVTALYQAGTRSASLLNAVTRPSGKAYAAVSYDPVTAAVTHLTDENGGSWSMAAPKVTGSSQVYRSAVMGSGPTTYFRLGESAGASAAVDEVKGGNAAYSNVTLGAAGPFADATAASFNGSSSLIQLPGADQVGTGPSSVEMWFKMPSGSATGGVLFDYAGASLTGGSPATNEWDPALYVDTTGILRGRFWGFGYVISKNKVNDGKWHHVLLAASTTSEAMYVDGVAEGTATGTFTASNSQYVYVGAGEAQGWPSPPTNALGDFPGSIAEFAFYHTQLTGQDAASHYAAGSNSAGLSPLETVTVTDPGGKPNVYQYDMLNGDRMVSQTDGLGDRTTYGYDTGGFLHTVTDPDGDVTTTGHDVRGNEVSSTTCQNQAAQQCSTSYTSYLPDDTSATLTPNPANDLVSTIRDGRSSSATDNTYLTSYAYDAAGDRTSVTTPPVPGFPNGRTTRIAYTDGTTIAAADTGFAPKGLPCSTVSAGGATTTIKYFHDGDVAQVTDPDGMVTKFTYDNLGRELSKTEISNSYPAGLVTSYVYDGSSQVTQETDPATTDAVSGATHQAQTTTVFDTDGQVLSQTVADLTGGDASRQVLSSYNAYDELQTSTDGSGAVTTYTYDGYGNQATVQDAAGNTTSYAYDADGHLLTQTLDAYTGDPVSPSAPVNLVESSRSYDPAGRLQSLTDAMGNTTSYTYTDNGLTATVTRTDPTGKLHFVEQSNSYDAAGNLVKQVTNNGATVVQSSLDAADRVTSTTVDPTGVDRTTTVSYTPDDRVATSTLTGAAGATHTTSQSYDPMGNLISRSVQEDGTGHPAGWWPLSQSGGSTVTDASGSGNTANASSGVAWSGGAATIAGGTSQAVATNGPVLNTTASYTVSAWANLSATTGYDTVVSQGGTAFGSFILDYNKGQNAWAFLAPASDSLTATQVWAKASTPPVLNTWTHLVGVFNSGTGLMQLYVNGALAGTTTDTTPWTGSGPLSIGNLKLANGGSYGSNPDTMSVSNVQAYPRALSATEVSALYTAGRSGGTTASSTQDTTSWQLDQRGLPTSMTDADQQVTDYTYDQARHLTVTSEPAVTTTAPGGTQSTVHPTSYTGYDTFGDAVESKDANGNVTKVSYDGAGRKTQQTLPSYTRPDTGATISDAGTVWAYDKMGNITGVTDPLQNTTHYLYDQLGDTSQVTDANNGTTHTLYDDDGQATSSTDPAGVQTQATYDYLGRQVTSSVLNRYPTASTSTTTESYTASATDPGGAFLASTTSQDGVVTQYGYDNVGEQTQVIDGAGNTTTYQYDSQGRRTSTTLPDQTSSTTSYDQLGDALTQQQLGTTGTVLASQSATYDAMGDVMSSTDADQHTTTYTRDALGELTSQTQPVDATHSITTQFGYDMDGNRSWTQDGRGNNWYYTVNSWNLPESTIEPAATSSTYSYTSASDSTATTSYDADGDPVTVSDPGGVTLSAGYDNLGNLTSQSGTGADAATANRSFSYDADNRMTGAATAAVGTTTAATSETFSYNDLGGLLSASGSGGSSSFTYNGDGQATSATDAAGTTNYGYDTAGRLDSLADPETGTQLGYTYNTLDQLSTVQYGSGGDTRSYGYNQLHQLTSDTLTTPGNAAVASIGYQYDADGNETSKTTSGLAGASSNTYTYDWSDRLASWNNGTSTTDYAYDASGNRIQAGANVYTYDARDQLTSDGVNTYSYTARGTMSLQVSASGSTAYTTDAYNQQATQGTQSYVYDALGRVLTDTATAGAQTAFSYEGAGNTIASDGSYTYSYTPGGSLVATSTTGTSPTATLADTDQHDDVVGSFTATGTALSGSTGYDPLGNVTATTGTPQGNLGYESGWTDSATGKVNMGSRWYNPATGQFMNKDTASQSATPNATAANPFAYVDDNPLTRTDPSGHGWWGDITGAASEAWHTASSWASDAWNTASSWASDAWDTASSWASDAWNTASSWASDAWHDATSAFDDLDRELDQEIASLNRQIAELDQEISDSYASIRRSAARAWHASTRVVSHAVHTVVHTVATTYHAVAKAVRTTATFFKNHAAAIASFAASTAVFMGCEAALGAVTGGVGAIAGAAGCGALSGAVGGAIDQGAKCVDGQSGACSVSSFAGATILGAVGGAVGGAFGGALGGKLAESALGDVLPTLVTNTLEGAAVGGISGGAVGAVSYGLTCGDSGGGCSWSGAADAAAGGAASGAIGGAAGGAIATGLGAISGGSDETNTSGGGCDSGPHSFTGSTAVLMADGSSKPIDQIKVGDRVSDSVPGEKGTQTHTVTGVIVTHTDHDFVDVTIAAAKPVRAAATSLKTRVLRKAALGLAASAAGAAALLGLGHHQLPAGASAPLNATAPVAYTVPAGAPTTSSSVLTTTFHHPFYDETQNSFVQAENLHPGDTLQTPTGTARVTAIHLYHANTTTYDLTIGTLHTYYVLAGSTPVLVHNVNLVSAASCPISGTKTPQQLGDDAQALHDANVSNIQSPPSNGNKLADQGTTVATGEIGGELVYSTNNNRASVALKALANQLGYRRIFGVDFITRGPDGQGLQTDAEQILFNAIEDGTLDGDGTIVASRPACGPERQDCAARGNDFPNIQLFEQPRVAPWDR